jgi:hypothetical protein
MGRFICGSLSEFVVGLGYAVALVAAGLGRKLGGWVPHRARAAEHPQPHR